MEYISQTPFTTEEANNYFGDYPDDVNFRRDRSFESTIRALYGVACERDKWPNFLRAAANYTAEDFPNYIIADDDEHGEGGIVRLYSMLGGYEIDKEANIILVDGRWEEIVKIQKYFQQQIKVRCFVSKNIKSTIVLYDGSVMTTALDRFLQSALLSFTPWVNPTPEMIELETSLTRGKEEYLACLDKFSKIIDIRSKYIDSCLGAFESKMLNARVKNIESNNEGILEQIMRYYSSIREHQKMIYENNIKITGMRSRANDVEDDNEIAEYFKSNKALSVCNKDVNNDSEFGFVVNTTLEYYDVDQAEAALKNKRSFIYGDDYGTYDSGYISSAGMAKLIKAIFVDEKLRLHVCGAYVIDIESGVFAPRGRDFSDSDAGMNCLPNPHLYYYSCLGNYERQINECISNGDYVMAVQQCIASCKSLNFGDYAVMSKFMDMMYGTHYGEQNGQNRKCIELPTGEIVRPEDALVYLENIEKEEGSDGTENQD